MAGSLTPEQRTKRLFELLDLARGARGLILDKTVELEPKIGEILAWMFAPEAEPRRVLQTLVFGGLLGFEKKVELLDTIIGVEYSGVVSEHFKAKLKNLNTLRNAAAHYALDDSDQALEHRQRLRVQLVGYNAQGKRKTVVITTQLLESIQNDMDLIIDDLEHLAEAIRQRRNLPPLGEPRFSLPEKPR